MRNAERHIANDYLSVRDIQNCYHSVRPKHVLDALVAEGVPAAIGRIVTKLVTVDGLLPQGAPTSPRVLDILMRSTDEAILVASARDGATFSRYVDDLCFSGAAPVEEVVKYAEDALGGLGLRLHPRKSRDWGPCAVKTVTGIVVGSTLSATDDYVEDLLRLIAEAPASEIRVEAPRIRSKIAWIRQIGDKRTAKLDRALSRRIQ